MPEHVDAELAGKTVPEVLQVLKPHLRRVIESIDPVMLPAFDAAYDDGALDVAHAMIRPPTAADELSGEQGFGLRGHLVGSSVAFVINFAAAVAVARCQNDDPGFWAWLTGSRGTPVASKVHSDPLERLVAISRHSPAEKARIAGLIRGDRKLMRILDPAGSR